MKFHMGSFVVGLLFGVGVRSLSQRLRPVALEVATAGFRLADAVGVAAATRREDLEDLLAEARARARGLAGPDVRAQN